AEAWAEVARTLRQHPDAPDTRELGRYVARLGERSHAGQMKSRGLSEAWVLSQRAELAEGRPLLPGVQASLAQSLLGGSAVNDGPPWSLVQRGPALWLVPGRPNLALAVCTAQPDGLWVELQGSVAWRPWPQTASCLVPSLEEGSCAVIAGHDRYTVSTVDRPRWAEEWGRDDLGLYALTPRFGKFSCRVDTPDGHSFNTQQGAGQSSLPAWLGSFLGPNGNARLRVGLDLEFGVWAEIAIHTATQRLRWLPPGEFWMGSTDAERARITNEDYRNWAQRESPRHRVALTQGFWLADTACTQALWQALMGKNPSHFKSESMLPVENVSHDDVQQFLARLQAQLPEGLTAGLPTEAEWEYACRAGTDTAFSFGDHVAHGQVNMDELEGFARPGAEPEPSRGKTVPVASLPPNAWGLYEMHGNVLEWCADGLREYVAASDPVADPQGPQDRARFAVRGGSWLYDARDARSACRAAYVRADRLDSLGFRFALRSTSTSPGTAAEPLDSPGPEARGQARRDAGPRQKSPPRRKR
ncbi:hypothetical protein DBR42_22660, partial [Pelomonas sp. HMWF004]